MLECQVELFGVAWLVVGKDPDDPAARVVGRGQVHRRNSGEPITHAACNDEISRAETVDRSKGNVALQTKNVTSVTGSVVENSEAAAQHSLARNGVGKSESGRKPFFPSFNPRILVDAIAPRHEYCRCFGIKICPAIRYFTVRGVELVA